MDCKNTVQSYLKQLEGNFRCSQEKEFIRIITPYLYPDHDLIEIFLKQVGDKVVRATDFGETLRKLESQGIDILNSTKRLYTAEKICSGIGVKIHRGCLEKEGETARSGEIMFDLLAAIKAVADLVYTSKAYEPATFDKEVEKYLAKHQVRFEPNVEIKGMSGRDYRVGFRIPGPKTNAILVETLSPKQESGMSSRVSGIVRMWVDINHGTEKISLFNDKDFHWKVEDMKLLSRFSRVAQWSKKDDFLEMLK